MDKYLTEEEIFGDLPVFQPLPFIPGYSTEPSEVGVEKIDTKKRPLCPQTTDSDDKSKIPQVAAKRHKEEPKKSRFYEKTDKPSGDEVSNVPKIEPCAKFSFIREMKTFRRDGFLRAPSGKFMKFSRYFQQGEGTRSVSETGTPRTQMTSSSVRPSVKVPPSFTSPAPTSDQDEEHQG